MIRGVCVGPDSVNGGRRGVIDLICVERVRKGALVSFQNVGNVTWSCRLLRISANSSVSDSQRNEYDQLGSCFQNQTAELQPNKPLHFAPSRLMPGKIYNFTATMTKKIKNGTSSIVVRVVEGKPPHGMFT